MEGRSIGLLVAALALVGAGAFLVAQGAQTSNPPPPPEPPLPNFYPGPQGEILQAVGPYGVPNETLTT